MLTYLHLPEAKQAVLPTVAHLNCKVVDDVLKVPTAIAGNVHLLANVDVGLLVSVEPEAHLEAGRRVVAEAVMQANVDLEALVGFGFHIAQGRL